jgi:hypothetical protein
MEGKGATAVLAYSKLLQSCKALKNSSIKERHAMANSSEVVAIDFLNYV